MVIIWGSNFSVIKIALREFPEATFNALRLLLASAVFIAVILIQARRSGSRAELTRGDWGRILLLGVIGHLLYQLAFLAGVVRTSVANAALIFGCTPVSVALLSSIAGHERLAPSRWIGAALSLAGIYALVGHSARLSSATLAGDALVLVGMLCWSCYSVLAQPLLSRHSPLVVTGWSMAAGTVLYLVIAAPTMAATNWRGISAASWFLMAASSLLALAFAYMVWYTAVQRIGSSRTALYSNLTPIVAMVVAAIWLGERITLTQLSGAVLILAGLAITRIRLAA